MAPCPRTRRACGGRRTRWVPVGRRQGGRPARRSPGGRAVLIHGGDADLVSAGPQLLQAKLLDGRLAPGPQHGDRTAEHLVQIIADRLGEHFPYQPALLCFAIRRQAGLTGRMPGPHDRLLRVPRGRAGPRRSVPLARTRAPAPRGVTSGS